MTVVQPHMKFIDSNRVTGKHQNKYVGAGGKAITLIERSNIQSGCSLGRTVECTLGHQEARAGGSL